MSKLDGPATLDVDKSYLFVRLIGDSNILFTRCIVDIKSIVNKCLILGKKVILPFVFPPIENTASRMVCIKVLTIRKQLIVF